MTERLGRFQRITADEAQQRLTAARPAPASSEQLATFFATMEPLTYYELVLKRKEKGAILRERLMRFVEENALEGVHVRAGRKYDQKTVIIWRESGQQTRPESGVQDPPAGFSPGAEEGDEPQPTGGAGTGGGDPRCAPTRGRAVHHGFRYRTSGRHGRQGRTSSRSGGRAREPWVPWRRRRERRRAWRCSGSGRLSQRLDLSIGIPSLEARVGFQGRGCAEVVPPDLCRALLRKALGVQ